MNRALIAVLEDEKDILEMVAEKLRAENFSVETFERADAFLRFLSSRVPDLLILDLMLPDADGLDICRQMRGDERWKDIPIIMLTAKAAETDRVVGLELGADDYVTKPFSPRELVARIRALLRRREQPIESRQRIGGDLVLDAGRQEVTAAGRKVDLTTTEFRILQLLASRPGWVFSRQRILDHLWGNEKIVIDRTVDVHIRHIRAKLGAAGRRIRNIRAAGYKLEP